MKEVKKEVKSKNFYLSIIHLLQKGERPSNIVKILNIPKQNLQYYLNKLKKRGAIVKRGYGSWEVKKEVKTFLNTSERDIKLTDLHAFNIKFPIISGKIEATDWEIKNKLNNWLPKYKKFDVFEGLTIRNNNNKSISVFLRSRKVDLVKDPYYVEKLAFRIKTYLHEYFKVKHNVILDVFAAETKNIHLETQDQDKLEGFLRKGEVYEVDLRKKAKKIYPQDDIDAKAWLDNSPEPNMIATNDLEYKRELVFMPFRIRSLLTHLPLMQEYNKNLKLHIKVQQEQLKTQKEIRKLLKKLKRNI